ncbi:MAG: thermonuclease family protein [Alphaproteobacteria bacterium]|nr:thermonuclease family protein [Alphaproteobacteria bacterium]
MKKLLILAILLFSPFITYGKTSSISAKVDYIFDGDTFAAIVKLENSMRISVRVRILEIDTPEIHGECESEIIMANKARKRLKQLLPIGSSVELSNIKDDKYLGRINAKVKLPDGRDVSKIMLQEKLARKYTGGKRQSWCK